MGIALDKSSGKMKENTFPFLGFPGQTKSGQELSQGVVQAAVVEVEKLKILFGYNLEQKIKLKYSKHPKTMYSGVV